MAITNNGTKNSLPDNQLPTGYSRPAVTEFTDYEWHRTITFSVTKATVESATPATTMANIITNGTVGITKQVTDLVTSDFDATKTVTIYADMVALSNNLQSMAGGSPAFTNAAAAYLATVNIYVKSV